jgi:hypothetical protein
LFACTLEPSAIFASYQGVSLSSLFLRRLFLKLTAALTAFQDIPIRPLDEEELTIEKTGF